MMFTSSKETTHIAKPSNTIKTMLEGTPQLSQN